MLTGWGVKPSYSPPSVSDDSAYAQLLFRTAKYRSEFAAKGFETIEAAHQWGAAFVHWYVLHIKVFYQLLQSLEENTSSD